VGASAEGTPPVNTLIEVGFYIAQMPGWFGWLMIGGGCCALAFHAGANTYRD
jgi:hypothetical protein